MSTPRTHQEQIEKLHELIEDIDFAMLTTVDRQGNLRSRPMSTQIAKTQGVLHYFTDRRSEKVEEAERDARVNVSYSSPKKSEFVSVSGTARISSDRQLIKALWKPIHKVWFPEGVDDPNLVLFEVQIEHAEYWDDTSNKMIQLFKMAKAAVGGTSYEAENQKIDL